MEKSFRTFAYLAIFAFSLTLATPLFAQESVPSQQAPMMRGHHGPRHGGGSGGCGCHGMMMQEGSMGSGRGMSPCMIGHDMMSPEMMPPSGKETPEMAQLRQEIAAQHQSLQSHRVQMRAECQKMSELIQRMKDMRMHKSVSKAKSSPSKGNASPQNPSISGN